MEQVSPRNAKDDYHTSPRNEKEILNKLFNVIAHDSEDGMKYKLVLTTAEENTELNSLAKNVALTEDSLQSPAPHFDVVEFDSSQGSVIQIKDSVDIPVLDGTKESRRIAGAALREAKLCSLDDQHSGGNVNKRPNTTDSADPGQHKRARFNHEENGRDEPLPVISSVNQNDNIVLQDPDGDTLQLTGSLSPRNSRDVAASHKFDYDPHLSVAKDKKSLRLPIVPANDDEAILSDYNYCLTQNVEFFEVIAERPNAPQKIGIRCIHCAHVNLPCTESSIFPRCITSLASAIGTIGARHFVANGCSFLSEDIVEYLAATKRVSSMQTRSGRTTLDAYMQSICLNYGLMDSSGVGIQFQEGSRLKEASHQESRAIGFASSGQLSQSAEANKSNVTSLITRERSFQSFEPGVIPNFWQCKHCKSVPIIWRASGSVVFSPQYPPTEKCQKHLENCVGDERLFIPRDSNMLSNYNNPNIICIKWSQPHRAVEKLASDAGICKYDDTQELVAPEDKRFTTDFAYFAILQLRKTILNKTGGARSSCPFGYPGLACRFCAGRPNERKFFFTNPDHLRNSFAHIPTHLMECAFCPKDVKERLATFKEERSRQKLLLRSGSHKMFIERVWSRVHGGSISVETQPRNKSKAEQPSSNILPFSPSSTTCDTNMDTVNAEEALALPVDKPYTTDYSYFTMLQLAKCQLEKEGGSRGACPIGFPGLACIHCAGQPNERRFFFTSPDHLRNSYSHIPTHLLECQFCPLEVKSTIVALREERQKQKTLLKPGSHKRFIDTVWQRLHGTNSSASKALQEVCPGKDLALESEGNRLRTEDCLPLTNNDNLMSNGFDIRYCKEMSIAYPQNELCSPISNEFHLLVPEMKEMSSDFVFFALQHVTPFVISENDGGKGKFPVGYPGLVCKYCVINQQNGRKYFSQSADQFRFAFESIPNHIALCAECPQSVKDTLAAYKETRPNQESKLRRGARKAFMDIVWNRLMSLEPKKASSNFAMNPPNLKGTLEPEDHYETKMEEANPQHVDDPAIISRAASITDLILDEDRSLTTEFTYITFCHVQKCWLRSAGNGNGSRSSFQTGFPGLECKYCAHRPSGRKFFYRTVDVLTSNYAHVPNHLLSCVYCPRVVKDEIVAKRQLHLMQKSSLRRGSQRKFFERLWKRLHC